MLLKRENKRQVEYERTTRHSSLLSTCWSTTTTCRMELDHLVTNLHTYAQVSLKLYYYCKEEKAEEVEENTIAQ